MDSIQNYTQVTTIALCLLIACQVIFLVVVVMILIKVKKVLKNIQKTTSLSKEFIRSLRDEQLKRVPLWKLGLVAFKQARSFKHH